MKNDYEVRGDTVAIFIRCQGETLATLIDADDFDLADSFPNTWYGQRNPNNRVYVRGYVKAKRHDLHNYICPPAEGEEVDHVNLDTLDNRRANLRSATRSANNLNRDRARSDSVHSSHRGVFWHNASARWCARVTVNGKTISLGYFDKEAEAAAAAAATYRTIDVLRDYIWPNTEVA